MSNMYSYLFHDANIKEENIIDSNAAWTETTVTSLQIKKRKTHLLFVFDLKIYRNMRLIKKKKTQSFLRFIGWFACNEWT